VTWEDTSKTRNEDEQASIIEHPENAKPLFSSESGGKVGASEEWRNWPLHSFDTDPMTGGMDGLWAGHLWTYKDKDTKPKLSLGLMQLRLEFDSSDSLILKGTALSYFVREQVSGRRRKLDDGVEEFDVLMTLEMELYSHRLVGRYIEADETLVGSYLVYVKKEDGKKAYDDHPFSLQTEQSSDKPQNANADAGTPLPVERKFLFRRTPAEAVGFWKISDEGTRKDAKRRWEFVRDAVLYLVKRRLWSSALIKAWCVDSHTFVDLYRREWLIASEFLVEPLTPAEQDVEWELRYRLCASIIRPSMESMNWSLERLSCQ
jgi:hypothetical protein